MDISTITLDKNVKKQLNALKSHPRESYNDVVTRLLSKIKSIDLDSLKETIEIMSDPETMRSLAKSLDDIKKRKLYSIEEV